MIRIRSGVPGDTDAICRVSEASIPGSWNRSSVLSELEGASPARFLVAEEEGRILGYIHWWMVIDEAQIMNLAVWPACRRSGIGRELLRAAIGEARREGAESMVLEVREGNTPARRLYETAGFTIVATRTGYYPDNRENALFMRLAFVQV